MSRVNFAKLLFLAAITCPWVGCGDGGPPTGEISGKVFFNDELVGDCLISLYAPATRLSLGAKVGQDGTFSIEDVPLGEYQIAVRQKTSNSPKEQPFDKRIPKKYRSGETSGFSTTIVEGENSVDLKMDG